MEDELTDRVRKSRYLPRRQFRRKVLYAREWIGVRPFAAKEFDQRAFRHEKKIRVDPCESVAKSPRYRAKYFSSKILR
jgi:hypothetical protein